MEGYIMNLGPGWAHAMKRAVGPGAKISLDELYEQYGNKHNLREGKEFVDWLKGVKLTDPSKWKIVFADDVVVAVESKKTASVEEEPVQDQPLETTVTINEVKTGNKRKRLTDNIAPIVEKKLGVKDIVDLSVRDGREIISKISDLNLLKYALQEANQLAGKDSLCIVLRKRIKELQLNR